MKWLNANSGRDSNIDTVMTHKITILSEQLITYEHNLLFKQNSVGIENFTNIVSSKKIFKVSLRSLIYYILARAEVR